MLIAQSMRRGGRLPAALTAVAAVLALSACDGDRGPAGPSGPQGPAGPQGPGAPGLEAACTPVSPLPTGLPPVAVALTSSGTLVRFSPASMSDGNEVAVLGLQAGEEILGIDFRPTDGALIAATRIGTMGNLIRINPVTGDVTRLTRTGATGLTFNGQQYGVDFNPVPGALRIVGDNDENFRIVFSGPERLSYTVNVDTTLAPAADVVAAAYTNNFTGTPVTTLYNLDATADTLVTQGGVDSATNPNAGGLATVGALGVDFDARAGFDIDGVTGIALAALNVSGAPSTGLYAVNLGSGEASCVGTIPVAAGQRAVGLAIPAPQPAVAFGLTTTDALVNFVPNAAGVATASAPVAITGIGASESIVGMDIRPRTGALTVVTRNATTNGGALYEVDPSTGVATAIPANMGQMLAFDAAATVFGVDFNPVPNALRVVNNANQNFRITFPADAAGYNVVADGAVNPVGTSGAAGYTWNYDGTTATRLYVIDTTTNQLKFQNPPNDGTQSVVGSLGVTSSSGNSGFDIIGGAGVTAAGINIGNTVSFAALNVGTVTNLYRINLETGAATQIGSGPVGGTAPVVLKGLAVQVRR